jgi:hypothetical protein
MDLVHETRPGPAAPAPLDPGFVERRAMRRAACPLEVTARQRGRFAVAAATTDLTPYGARLSGAGPFEPGSELWLRLPGLESLTVQVIWSDGPATGVAFHQPLHTAVYARFLPADGRLQLVTEPAVPPVMPAEIARLPRREQIVRGFGAAMEGPQRHAKQPLGGGMTNLIRRSVVRRAEHRREERFADALRTGPMRLTVGAYPAQVRDVSASGLKVAAMYDAEVGMKVAVEFEGFDAMAARVVWRRENEIGLSLPADSLDLDDA